MNLQKGSFMWEDIECGNCSGTGEVVCDRCGGTGSLPGFATFGGGFTACDVCGGHGYMPCQECDGSGYTEEWIDDDESELEDDDWGKEEYDLLTCPDEDRYSYVFKYAENGNILAQYDLGMIYLNEEINLDQVYESENLSTYSFEEYCLKQNISLKEEGDEEYDEEDQYEYYSFYEADKYESLSQKWFRQAAKQGYTKAQLKLIKIYTEYDYSIAIEAIEYGIQQGYLTGNVTEIALNALHNKEIGVPFENRDDAEKWFRDGEKQLSNFIRGSSDLSSNFSTWKELILVFNNHLSYTPRKNRTYKSNTKIVQEDNKIVFNDQAMIEELYTFAPLEHILTNQKYDTKNILLEYLKVETTADKSTMESSKEESSAIKHKDRYLAIKSLNELIIKFTGSAYLENRKLALLFDDLKVLSMIMRTGVYQRWILEDEFFDLTYKIWSKLFFSSESQITGFVNYRLNNENNNIEILMSADFSASMLAWIFMIKAPNNPKYIQFIWSVVSIHYNNNWIFYGGDKEEINKELNKTLLAIYGYADTKNLLKMHGAFWKIILKAGNSFQNLISKLSNYKAVDFKDKIGTDNIQAGELLWQGKGAFYIVQHSYLRSAKTKDLIVDVISTNAYEPDKKFQAQFTIPLKKLLQINNTFIGKEDKKSIINFIHYCIFKFNDYTALIEDEELILDEIKDTKLKKLSTEIDNLKNQSQQDILKIQKLYEEIAEQGDPIEKYNMGNRYKIGDGVPQNYERAAKWYLKAEEQAHMNSRHFSFSMHSDMTDKYRVAMERFKKTIELGLAAAKYNVEEMYSIGDKTNKDIAETWYQESKMQESREASDLLEEMDFYRRKDKTSYALEDIREEAENGDADAQYTLGWRHYSGYEIYKDYEIAAEWYQKAAMQGLARAQYNLGNMYISGKGVAQDEDMAIKWFKLAAEQRSGDALDALGKLYSKQDKKIGEYWLKRAAHQREVEAQYALGMLMFMQNDEMARKWLKKSAEQKYNPALYSLGVLYQDDASIKYLKMAAEQGYSDAQYMFGMLHCSNEKNIKKNTSIALKWLRKAAGQGQVEAQFRLGSIYPDRYRALMWYEKAARRGYIHAQYLLGKIYDNECGKIYDNWIAARETYLMSIEWYRKAARQGHAEAQYLSATYADEEKEKEEWLRDAARQGHMEAQFELHSNFWCEKAAEQGHIEAQYRLGDMFYAGESIEQDYEKSIYWYKKATEREHTNAYSSLKYLYNKHRNSDPEEVNEIFRLLENEHIATANYSLGNMAENGLGMEKNLEKALIYYEKAMNLGNKEAQANYFRLKK